MGANCDGDLKTAPNGFCATDLLKGFTQRAQKVEDAKT
jgi:hypothetical protein